MHHIADPTYRPLGTTCANNFRRLPDSEGNSQLLKILLSESWHWETVTFESSVYEWKVNLDTFDTTRPVKCDISDLRIFSTPNLGYRLLLRRCSDISDVPPGPTPTIANVRLICNSTILPPMPYASSDLYTSAYPRGGWNPRLVWQTSDLGAFLPWIIDSPHLPSGSSYIRPKFIAMLQNSILVGEPKLRSLWWPWLLDLAIRMQVVDIQTTAPLRKTDAGITESLLSVVEEVTVHGEVVCWCASRN